MAAIEFKLDTTKFDAAFKLYKEASKRDIEYIVQKQAHNLSLQLFKAFKEIAPTKQQIYSTAERLKFRIKLFKTSPGPRGISNGNKKLNARHLDIQRELIARARSVGASAAGWLMFYNRKVKEGDKLVPRNRKDTNEAQVYLADNKSEVLMINKVKNIDKVIALNPDLVQSSVDLAADDMLKYVLNAQKKAMKDLSNG